MQMRKKLTAIFIALLLSAYCSASGLAVEPDEILADSVLEDRARHISSLVRCTVCQNQSIDDSNAPLARDLRILVREKLVEGYSDEQIFDHLVARYGEFVLLKPVFALHTFFLWFMPGLALVAGFVGAIMIFRNSRQHQTASKALSRQEQKQLTKIMNGND